MKKYKQSNNPEFVRKKNIEENPLNVVSVVFFLGYEALEALYIKRALTPLMWKSENAKS